MRPLLLNGFMATGKSTVARAIANKCGCAVVDLDAQVEERAGQPIAEIFSAHGEAHFRKLETEVLGELLAKEQQRPTVVALGGGALLQRETRIRALRDAVVVTLHAKPGIVARRASRAAMRRPLLAAPDPQARIRELLEARATAYSECHAQLDTSRLPPSELAAEALKIWEREPIAVAAGERSYRVEVGDGCTRGLLQDLVLPASGALCVSDHNVSQLHGELLHNALESTSIPLSSVNLEPGETQKNLRSLERIWNAAYEQNLDRKGVMVAHGGGVVTDVAGFAAATWLRGVPWVALPTTLLAMVDASVGGKTAVDFKDAKNSVGAFWQPRGVICDVSFLATEAERAYRGALAEVVKTGLIGDPGLLDLLEGGVVRVAERDPALLQELVRRSIQVKAHVVSLDERESGLRATLNLGHTVGHALESHGDYTRLTHGEAVSLGVVAALRLGQKLGHTPQSLCVRIEELLSQLGLPTDLSAEPLAEAAQLIGRDKKRAGSTLRFVFARDAGDVTTENIELEALHQRICSLV